TTGVVSVVVGSLPFLGLVVPNIVSMFRGDNLRTNLPWVVMVVIVVITLTDIVGRTIIMPFEIPVSMILGVLGATVFVYLIVRRGRGGSDSSRHSGINHHSCRRSTPSTLAHLPARADRGCQ